MAFIFIPMAKRDKYIQKALDALNINYDNLKHEFELNTLKDLDFIHSSRKALLSECEGNLEDIKSAIEQIKNELQTLEDLKHQVKVEEYKEINPKARVF